MELRNFYALHLRGEFTRLNHTFKGTTYTTVDWMRLSGVGKQICGIVVEVDLAGFGKPFYIGVPYESILWDKREEKPNIPNDYNKSIEGKNDYFESGYILYYIDSYLSTKDVIVQYNELDSMWYWPCFEFGNDSPWFAPEVD